MNKSRLLVVIVLCLLLIGCGEKQFYCEKGELIDNKCKVVDKKDANIVCPNGYTFNKEKGKCVYQMTIAAKTVNTCSKGYRIGNEKWCFSEEKYDMVLEKSCESSKIKEGDTLSSTYVSESGLCYEKICTEKSEDGKTCLKYEENNIQFKVTKKCPKSNMIKLDGYCHKIAWLYIDKSCEVGELVGDKCVIEQLSDASASCDSGYSLVDGFMCQKIYYEGVKEK